MLKNPSRKPHFLILKTSQSAIQNLACFYEANAFFSGSD